MIYAKLNKIMINLSDEEEYSNNGLKVGCDTCKKQLNINSQNYL